MIKYFVLHIILIIYVLLVDKASLLNQIGYIYLIQYSLFIVYIFKIKKENRIYYFLKPSILILSYICLSFGLGAIYLNNGYGLLERYINIYHSIVNFKAVNIFYLLCNLVVFYTSQLLRLNKYLLCKIENQNSNHGFNDIHLVNKSGLIISIIIFIFFNLYELNLNALGGSGSFSYVPKLVSTIYIFIYFSNRKYRFRFFVYTLIVLSFLLTNFGSKREIIYVLLLIVYIENYWNPVSFSLNLKSVTYTIVLLLSFIILILISSVKRGYGNYDTKGLVETVNATFYYVNSDIFLDALGENFEINYVYGNAINAADIYFNGTQETLYGLTYAKALFIFIPRSAFGYKPPSMLQLYTPRVTNAQFESNPVLYYAELLWNFGLLFFLGLVLITVLLEYIYKKMLLGFSHNKINIMIISCLFLYSTIIQFIRGSGLDLYLLYYLVSIPFIVIIYYINKIKIT